VKSTWRGQAGNTVVLLTDNVGESQRWSYTSRLQPRVCPSKRASRAKVVVFWRVLYGAMATSILEGMCAFNNLTTLPPNIPGDKVASSTSSRFLCFVEVKAAAKRSTPPDLPTFFAHRIQTPDLELLDQLSLVTSVQHFTLFVTRFPR